MPLGNNAIDQWSGCLLAGRGAGDMHAFACGAVCCVRVRVSLGPVRRWSKPVRRLNNLAPVTIQSERSSYEGPTPPYAHAYGNHKHIKC